MSTSKTVRTPVVQKNAADVLVPAPPPALCLAYANTLTWRGSAQPTDSLPNVEALLDWIGRECQFDPRATRGLRDWAVAHAGDASVLFGSAVALRETIFRVFEAVAARKRPADTDFAALSSAIATAPPRAVLARKDHGYVWRIAAPLPTAAQLLAPVLWSAADLLLDSPRRRIRQCANEKCLWLFVDESKSGTRRWCDMGSCGNRAKAQRHYAKVRRG
jgi:predicted RNA-binding Zn ribbon-like protein